jgi:hypothetical protein
VLLLQSDSEGMIELEVNQLVSVVRCLLNVLRCKLDISVDRVGVDPTQAMILVLETL